MGRSHGTISKLLLLASFAMGLAACSQAPLPPEGSTAATPNALQCPEQRPQICTQDYRPVCATRDTGIRCVRAPCPSATLISYANACSACADPKVASYTAGACPDTKAD